VKNGHNKTVKEIEEATYAYLGQKEVKMELQACAQAMIQLRRSLA